MFTHAHAYGSRAVSAASSVGQLHSQTTDILTEVQTVVITASFHGEWGVYSQHIYMYTGTVVMDGILVIY